MKKTISFILSLVMILSFSTVAFAYHTNSPSSTTPCYGISLGDGVRIRQTASIDAIILGQIDRNKPIEIIGVPNASWYKVRYTESGETGYISSDFLSLTHKDYGYVLSITGIDMKASKGSSTTVTHVPYGRYMPYRELSVYGSYVWADCVCGRTKGWVNTYNSYDFKYTDI